MARAPHNGQSQGTGSPGSLAAESGRAPSRRLSLAPGEILFRQGDDSDLVYMVESGRIETYRERPGGSDEPRARFGPGESFGRPAPLHSAPRTECARAVETTVLLAYEPQAFRTRQDSVPRPGNQRSI